MTEELTNSLAMQVSQLRRQNDALAELVEQQRANIQNQRSIIETLTARQEEPTNTEEMSPKQEHVAKRLANLRAELKENFATMNRVGGLMQRLPIAIIDKCVVTYGKLDIDRLTREEVVAVMSALHAGRWEKQQNLADGMALDYTAEIDAVRVRLWAAAPPESCRIIETEEIIPEQRVTRRRLVCSEANS